MIGLGIFTPLMVGHDAGGAGSMIGRGIFTPLMVGHDASGSGPVMWFSIFTPPDGDMMKAVCSRQDAGEA